MNEMPEPKAAFSVFPVGYVRVVEQEGKYEIRLLPPYQPALARLDEFSHVVVVWWADRHDRAADRKILTTELPYAPGIQAGVFACRSEYRPNPIGITVMPILAIDHQQGIITLPWIDAFDGTPVLDLKPYLPVSDRIRDVKVAGWMQDWPEWMEDADAFFAEKETKFGG